MVFKRNWLSHLSLSVTIGAVVFILAGCTSSTGKVPQASPEVVSSSSLPEQTLTPPESTTVETGDGGTPITVPSSNPDLTVESDEMERSTPAPTATFDSSTWQDLTNESCCGF